MSRKLTLGALKDLLAARDSGSRLGDGKAKTNGIAAAGAAGRGLEARRRADDSLWQKSRRLIRTTMLVALVSIALIEIMLRGFSQYIPLFLLANFNPVLRAEIATGLAYPAETNTKIILRDDGGPPLRLPMPLQTIRTVFRGEGSVSSVAMDRRGFCNPAEKGAENYRPDVITLGDSFTGCFLVAPEDAWPHQLSKLTGLKTYNLGLGGVGPFEYLQLMKSFGSAMGPSVVVMNFYEGNDFRDALDYHHYRAEKAARDRNGTENGATSHDARPEDHSASAGVWALDNLFAALRDGYGARHSYTLSLLLAATKAAYNRTYCESDSIASWKTGHRSAAARYCRVNFRYRLVFGDQERAFNLENVDADEAVHALRLAEGTDDLSALDEALAAFAGLSRQHGFRAVVVYTPSAHTAYARQVRFDDPALASLLTAASRRQRRYLAAQARELGFEFLDLTPSLQRAATQHGLDRLLYYPTSLHLTETGHRIVARSMADQLRPKLPRARQAKPSAAKPKTVDDAKQPARGSLPGVNGTPAKRVKS